MRGGGRSGTKEQPPTSKSTGERTPKDLVWFVTPWGGGRNAKARETHINSLFSYIERKGKSNRSMFRLSFARFPRLRGRHENEGNEARSCRCSRCLLPGVQAFVLGAAKTLDLCKILRV